MNSTSYRPRTLDTLRIADKNLRAVLEGKHHLLFDGGMGTMLQAAGLAAGAQPELITLEDPAAITRIHAAYVEAGADVVTTNTFGANRLKLGGAATVEEVFAAAVAAAKASGARYVAGDIGPLGALLRPLGTLSFDEAYELFAEEVRAAAQSGVDLIVIETMTDLAEARAAVIAAQENCGLPIFATMTFEEDGRTFLGTSPEIAARTLDALGVEGLGINCSLGPEQIRPFAQRMRAVTEKPVIVQANAGLPHTEDGRTVYDITPEAYAAAVSCMLDDGVTVAGGCCGTTPEYIRQIADALRTKPEPSRGEHPARPFVAASAQTEAVLDGRSIAVIGERINPTGKKRLQQALRDGDFAYLVGQGILQQEQSADILDVNVGLPDIDEAATMVRVTEELQAATVLPLQIDSSDPDAIEAAVRRYAGIAIINSVNGTRESMDTVLPIAARYGANIVALTLDEQGIPETAQQRVRIAERIVAEAARYGIPPHRILVDCLVMTASTNQRQALEILRAVTMCRERLGVHCALGVSNVSFGLPARELLNATFLAAAFGAGLDAPIINPGSARIMDVVRSYRVLNAEDEGSAAYIDRYADAADPYAGNGGFAAGSNVAGGAAGDGVAGGATGSGGAQGSGSAQGSGGAQGSGSAHTPSRATDSIEHLILTGRKGDMPAATREALETLEPMDVIGNHFIPALNEAGELFDAGKLFLPQLMAAAEAARAGFDVIRERVPAASESSGKAICLATVKGDIHDIGKNIVRMLLENYGYTVYDLGRDVAPEAVFAAVREHGARVAGLSALMTTTVPAMAETIELLHREAPDTKVIVGGAVLTPEYAAQIGADYYAKDAAAAARICQEVFNG